MATDPDSLDIKPWQQQPGESNRAFHAFTHFLSLLPHERSMAWAYTNHLIHCKGQIHPKSVHCTPSWQDWRFRHSWMERAAQQDAELTERARLIRAHDIEEMNKRHTQIAVALQNIVVERLQTAITAKEVFKLTPTQMAGLLDRAALVERRSRGEATSIVKHQGDDHGVALDLSKLSDAELEVFQSLVAKAEPGTKVEIP